MEVSLILLILSYVFLAAQDNIVAWYWAVRVAPFRARELIMSDPLFVETRDLLAEVKVEMIAVRAEQEKIVHDQIGLRTFVTDSLSSATKEMRSDVQGLLKDLQRDIKDMSKEKIDFTVPETEIRRITQSAQAAMRKSLQDGELLEGMEKILDEKLKALPTGDTDIEALLTDADMSSDEGRQQSYEWLLDKGLPESFAYRAAEKGPAVVRAIAKKKEWNILELMEGA